MALFVGRHVNKIDKKGRISVPKPFRAALQSVGSQTLYLYPLFKVTAVEACDEAFMSRLSASLDDLDMFSDEQDDSVCTPEPHLQLGSPTPTLRGYHNCVSEMSQHKDAIRAASRMSAYQPASAGENACADDGLPATCPCMEPKSPPAIHKYSLRGLCAACSGSGCSPHLGESAKSTGSSFGIQ